MRYLRRKNVSGAHDARKIAFAKVQTAALSFLLIHPEKSERCEHSNMLENIISDWEHGGRTTDRWYNTEQKSFCTHKCSVKCCTPGNRPRQDKARSLSLSANTSQNMTHLPRYTLISRLRLQRGGTLCTRAGKLNCPERKKEVRVTFNNKHDGSVRNIYLGETLRWPIHVEKWRARIRVAWSVCVRSSCSCGTPRARLAAHGTRQRLQVSCQALIISGRHN